MVEKPSLILKRTVGKQESLPASGQWFPGTRMRDGEVARLDAEAYSGKSLPRTDRMRGWQEECEDKQGKKDEVKGGGCRNHRPRDSTSSDFSCDLQHIIAC